MEIKVGVFYEKEFNILKLKMEELKSFAKERAIKLIRVYPDIPYNENSGLTLSKYLSFLRFDEDKGLDISADNYIKIVKIAEEWIEKQEQTIVD